MYTQCDTLLSLTYGELYDTENGTFLSDVPSLIPPVTGTLFGSIDNVGIYFADTPISD